MIIPSLSVKRDEILHLAVQAKLMLRDGDSFYLNDMACDKELIAFARLLERKLNEFSGRDMAGAE